MSALLADSMYYVSQIYWTDAGRNSIEVAELDGRNRKVLVWSGLESPRAIALHYHHGLMYWSDWGSNPRIEQADMDGDHRLVCAWIGGWVGPRADLDAMERRKFSGTCLKLNPVSLVGHDTD
jgi:hypothetical protein